MQTTYSDTRDFIVMSGPDGPRLPQLPSLDGLRGIAVAVVVLFHCGFSTMVGGYLGVSTFFTLSGFLITSLLLNESRPHGDRPTRHVLGSPLPAAAAGVTGDPRAGLDVVRLVRRHSGTAGDARRRRVGLALRRGQLAPHPAGHHLLGAVPGAVARAALLEPGDRGAVLSAVPAPDGRALAGDQGASRSTRRRARPPGGVFGGAAAARLDVG